MEWVNRHRRFVTYNLRTGPFENSFGRHVAVRLPVKYENRRQGISRLASNVTQTKGKIDLIVNAIHAYLIESGISITEYLRLCSLNDTNRRFLSACSSTECQDCLRQRTVHYNFVVYFVVGKTVHGPAQQRLLSFQHASGRRIFPRQPGEGRNLRMRHSVRHQYFFALGVIRYRLRLAEFQRHFVRRRATDRAKGRHVSIGRQWINGGGSATQIRNPQFLILDIDSQTRRIAEARSGSLEDPPGRHVASIFRAEDQNRLAHAVGDIHFALVRVHEHCSRPIQLGPSALHDAHSRSVTVVIKRVDRYRWLFEST